MTDSNLLNEREAARYIRMSVGSLRRWRQEGTGPTYRKFGKAVRYLQSDLDDFINERAYRSTAQAATA